jgi:ankyrin repeat protein
MSAPKLVNNESMARQDLHCAARDRNETEVRQLLLDRRTDVNMRNNDGQTPLLWAASGSHRELVRLLLRVSDIEASDKNGHTALLLASSYGPKYVV